MTTPHLQQRGPTLDAGADKLREAAAFLRAILPRTGLYCCFVAGRGHFWAESVEALARIILGQDGLGQTVYHACASFETRESRKASNVAFLRALWLDIDAGEGKPYADREEALTALRGFSETATLPAPWVVSSGNGLHAYWSLTRDLTLDEWRRYAQGLKALCARHGLHADETVTTDPVRILRTPGSHHRKDPSNVREVSVLSSGEPVEPDRLAFLLDAGPVASARAMNGKTLSLGERMAGGLAGDFPSWSATAEADLDNLLARIDGESRENWHDTLKVLTSWSVAEPSIEAALRSKFDAWSQKWPDKFDPEDQETQWRDGLRRARERLAKGEAMLGYGSLVMLAGGRGKCPSPVADITPSVQPAPDVDPTRFLPTDAGNALFFVELFKENIRWVEKWKVWFVWDGKRWMEASDAAMLPLARAATERMFDRASELPDENRTALRKHALATQREPRLRAMLDLAKGEPAIRAEPDRFDRDPWLLGCPSGVLDLRKGAMREPRRGDFLTKSIAVDYDPRAECPNWDALVVRITQGDSDTIDYLQRFAGYVLTGSVAEEKLFALFGSGSNVKTTFTMTLFELMGDYAVKARKDLLLSSQGEKGAASPDVAALQGKRLVIVSETDDGCTLAEAQIKEITSNEVIAARRLHRDPFTFTPSHKIILSTNNRPFVKGTDDGIWRRLDLIEFGAKIGEGEKDVSFREVKLRPELPGILRWAVEGCRKYQRNGLKPSAAVKHANSQYRSEMDFVAEWLFERCEPRPGAFTPRTVAYADYEVWARMEKFPVLGPRRFGEELNAHGYASDKSNGVRVFRGLKLKSASVAMRAVT